MLRFVLRSLGFVALWGLVGAVVIYVDPNIIRDIGLYGVYLPMVVVVGGAIFYTTVLIGGVNKFTVLVTIILTLFVALLFYF